MSRVWGLGLVLFLLCCLHIAAGLFAQSNPPMHQVPKLELPKVFPFGEYEDQYTLLYETYPELLLTVCENDMEVAFDKWMHMLTAMETYASEINFELKGIKLVLYVFWNEDGTIQHMTYYLKPNSLNVDTAELSAFISSFMNRYQLPIQAEAKFTLRCCSVSHYPLVWGVMP